MAWGDSLRRSVSKPGGPKKDLFGRLPGNPNYGADEPSVEPNAVIGGYLAGEEPAKSSKKKKGSGMPKIPEFATVDTSVIDDYLRAQRGQVGQNYEQVLADLARREAAGMQNVDAYGGQINDLYGSVENAFDQYTGNLIGAVKARGQNPAGMEGAFAPLEWAHDMGRAGALSMQPYLEQGLSEQMTTERGQAAMTRDQLLAQLAQQELEGRMGAEEARVASVNRAKELEYENALAAWERKNTPSELDEYEAKKQIDAYYDEGGGGRPYSNTEVSADRGESFAPQEADKIRKFRSYSEMSAEVNKAMSQPHPETGRPMTKQQIKAWVIQRAREIGQPRVASLILYDYGL